ncbi:hypothetical protein Taro_036355 [Colocasia esculenta]|uniref:Zinc finger HIT domain-containing protein n=1 Tax=Colocasia esculenta TaxID=4460 RepID=A0A843W1D0_COLES|nr:hypothetical protein [Colocasia esculenta]
MFGSIYVESVWWCFRKVTKKRREEPVPVARPHPQETPPIAAASPPNSPLYRHSSAAGRCRSPSTAASFPLPPFPLSREAAVPEADFTCRAAFIFSPRHLVSAATTPGSGQTPLPSVAPAGANQPATDRRSSRQCGVCRAARWVLLGGAESARWPPPDTNAPPVFCHIVHWHVSRSTKKFLVKCLCLLQRKQAIPVALPKRSCQVDEESWVLKKEQLKYLVDAHEIRDALKNEELRNLICAIDCSEDPEDELEKAMKTPSFREFAEKLLGPHSTG